MDRKDNQWDRKAMFKPKNEKVVQVEDGTC